MSNPYQSIRPEPLCPLRKDRRRARGLPRLAALLGLSLLATAWLLPAAALASDRPQIPSPEDRARVLRAEREGAALRAELLASALAEGLDAGVDALHYTLDLTFDHVPRTVTGTVTGRYEVLSAGLTTLALDLYDNMTVSSVKLGEVPLSFTHGSDRVTITLDRPYAVGEILEIGVSYSGTPANTGFGSFIWTTRLGKPVFWSLSEPTYGPTWWPSIDDPGDKVTAEMIFTVDNSLIAVSNGVLIGSGGAGGGRTQYHWQTDYPTAPYLISIACGDYTTYADPYTPLAGGTPMEVRYWVYPDKLSQAQGSFAITPSMIGVMAGLFGEYPFLNEKYAMALFTFGGGMEHQTATSYGVALVDGYDTYEWVIAHELAHQWWGDSLTLQDWREIWLHEGLATHSEPLYYETRYGTAYYHAYMNSLDPGSFSGPIYDNPSMFGSTVYDKGAWVMHMLRGVIGDAAFFNLLPAFHAQHMYGNVTTDDLRAAAEAAWDGGDLTWFFDQWIYAAGRPTYEWGWSVADTGSGYVLWVHIDQTQAGQQYRMPLDLRIQTTGGTTDVTAWSDPLNLDFSFPLPEAPTGVTLDPDNWVLNNDVQVTLPDGDGDGVPDTADNCQGLSNPAQENMDGDALGDPCDPDMDGDGVLNATDCAPSDPGAFLPPAEVASLSIDSSTLSWSSLAGQAGPGVVYDLLRGEPTDLPTDGGIDGAACDASGLAGLAASHGADPPPGGSAYFLVRGRNACSSGPFGADSSLAPRLNTACP